MNALDLAKTTESEGLELSFGDSDGGRKLWQVHGKVEKFDLRDTPDLRDAESTMLVKAGLAPFEVREFEGNLLTTAGLARKQNLLIGAGGQVFNNTNCRLGVGDATTAALVGDTDLGAAAGSTHRQFIVMDATFPSQSGTTLTFKATHTTGFSNFHWQEWGLDNGVSNGTTVTAVLLNHKIIDLGTKTSAASWAFTVTIVDS